MDISASMSGYLNKPKFLDIVRGIVDDRCGNAALIDVAIRTLQIARGDNGGARG
jgi:hypothetical protein